MRLTVVSPWITNGDHRRIEVLARHASLSRAEFVMITRAPASDDARLARNIVQRLEHHRIFINEQLHAKLYVCQQGDGRGVALIGSANLTASGMHMDEVGLLVRPLGASGIIDDLVDLALVQIPGRELSRARGPRRTA